jgi:hypothetical protein
MIVNSRKHHGIGFLLPFWGLLTACDIDSMLITGVADDTQIRIGEKGSSCPVWRCGFNSAEVFGNPIHALDLGGSANEAGIRIAAVIPGKAAPGGFNQLAVAGDAFVLRNAKGATIGGPAVVGTVLVLERDGQPIANLMIAAHQKVPRWADGASAAQAYGLVYVGDDGVSERNVCGGEISDPHAAIALVLGGETYDLATKQVAPAPGWFSVACAGSAAAKLSLLGYGPQSSPTTVKQRQATLKMITADYCGDGTSYTENGTPLLWENLSGSVDLEAAPGEIEAVWTSAGALCLDASRIPGVDVGCALPACDDFDLADGEWMTYLPLPLTH